MSKGRVLLFDIDGTLLSTDGAGRRAMERAFERVSGRGGALEGISFGGRTDRWIARVGLAAVGIEAGEEDIDGLLEVYLGLLGGELGEDRECWVHPGVEEVLSAVTGRAGVAVGLATGNVRRGAMMKLDRVGLGGRFSFGGFGCDDEVRSRILAAGVARGAAALGLSGSGCEVIVIGDTPMDVEAAHAVGGICLAVATGGYGAEALRGAGADYVVEDLRDPCVLPVLLGGAGV